ncbi:hypothetical protein CF326_g8073 [Tilletia indica]|nr:hypothetical protein CF326_g8073 [Tilletia indica]
MDPEPTEQPTSAEAAAASAEAANFADFDFSQFMLSSSSDSSTAAATQESSRQVYQSFHFPQSSPNTAVPHPSTTPRHSISLEQQQQQQVHSSDAAAASSEQDQHQLSAALQKGSTTTPLSSSAFDFSSLSQADIEALTGGSYHSLDQLMNIPQALTNSSNIPPTTISAHQAQSGTHHTTTASALSPTTAIRRTSQHSPIQSTSPTITKTSPTNTDSTTFLHPSRSKRRRSVDPSAAGGRNLTESTSLSTKPPFPFPRPGALKLPPPASSSSAMRSSLRAQAVAAAASSGMMEGPSSSNESNIGSSSSSSTTSRSTVRSTLGMGLRASGRGAAAGSRGMKRAQGSWESMTTIRSGSGDVRGGMSFGGAGASMKGGPGNSEEEEEEDDQGLVERGMMALPHGWVYVRLLDGRMTVPIELLARLQIPYSVLSSSSFSPNTIVPPHHHHHHGNPPTSPLLPPPTSSLRAFHSRVDTPSASPVALFAHTTSSARAPPPMSSGPTSPLAQTVGGGVVAMEEGDEEGGETDVDGDEKLRGEGVGGDGDGDAEVGGEERRDEEGRMRFYALTKREMELLLHWLRFELVPKHVRADLDLLGLLADRYELRELIEAVRDAKDTRHMSIKERAEFDGKAVGEMQRHLGSLILWPDPRNNRPEDDNNIANNSAAGAGGGGGANPNPSTGGQGTVAATIAGPSYQAVCAVLDEDLWDLVPGTRKLVKVDFRFPLGMARQGAISPFGSDQMREMQGQPGWDSLASSSSGRQTLWNTYRDDANRQVWHRIFFDTVAKRLWTDGFVIEREMVDCISSKVFYLISR